MSSQIESDLQIGDQIQEEMPPGSNYQPADGMGGGLRLSEEQQTMLEFLTSMFVEQLDVITIEQIRDIFISNNFDVETSEDEIRARLLPDSDDDDVNGFNANAFSGPSSNNNSPQHNSQQQQLQNGNKNKKKNKKNKKKNKNKGGGGQNNNNNNRQLNNGGQNGFQNQPPVNYNQLFQDLGKNDQRFNNDGSPQQINQNFDPSLIQILRSADEPGNIKYGKNDNQIPHDPDDNEDEIQKAIQASIDFQIEEKKIQQKIEQEYKKQEDMQIHEAAANASCGATPMGNMTTEEKAQQQSQMEEDEYQFLCDMFLGGEDDDISSCSTGIGDLIQKDEIRSLLREHGFDKCMVMLQDFQDQQEVMKFQDIENEEKEFLKFQQSNFQSEEIDGKMIKFDFEESKEFDQQIKEIDQIDSGQIDSGKFDDDEGQIQEKPVPSSLIDGDNQIKEFDQIDSSSRKKVAGEAGVDADGFPIYDQSLFDKIDSRKDDVGPGQEHYEVPIIQPQEIIDKFDQFKQLKLIMRDKELPSTNSKKNKNKKKKMQQKNENDDDILFQFLDEYVVNNFQQLMELQEKIEKDIDYVRNSLKYRGVEYPSLLDDGTKQFQKNRVGTSFPSFVDSDVKELAQSFTAVSCKEHQFMLGNISSQFPLLKEQIIQDTYERLKDPYLVLEILKKAFPKMHKGIVGPVQENKKLEEIIIANQGQGQKNYASDLDRFNYVNKGAKNNKFAWHMYANKFIYGQWMSRNVQQCQDDYDVYRRRPQDALNAEIREHQQLAADAYKKGDRAGVQYHKAKVRTLINQKSHIESKAELSMFQKLNAGYNLNDCMDLHMQHVENAKKIVRQKLIDVHNDLCDGVFEPNTGDGQNHIYKIVCGAGKHSKNGAKLKYAIPEMLKYDQYEIYENMEHGVFLVRLEKE